MKSKHHAYTTEVLDPRAANIRSAHSTKSSSGRSQKRSTSSDKKYSNCRVCANKDNFPFCMGACNIFHRRRRRISVQTKVHKETTPFEKWMNICLTPACLQYAFNESFTSDIPPSRKAEVGLGLYGIMLAEAAVFGGIGVTLWGIGKVLAKVIRQFQRPQYYPQERERRQRLAKERRIIKKRYTVNPAPTGDKLLAQWAKVRKNPQEMIRFGSMLCDIEAYVDNSLIRNEYGEIIGRNPGIRGWLAQNCPQLFRQYKTVMRYKATAEKFRQAFGLTDPYPAAMLLDDCEITVRKDFEGTNNEDKDIRSNRRALSKEKLPVNGNENMVRKTIKGKPVRVIGDDEVMEMKERARRLFEGSGKTERGLLAGIGMMVNPDTVPHEIELMERRRQGLPERDGLLRKFTKAMA